MLGRESKVELGEGTETTLKLSRLLEVKPLRLGNDASVSARGRRNCLPGRHLALEQMRHLSLTVPPRSTSSISRPKVHMEAAAPEITMAESLSVSLRRMLRATSFSSDRWLSGMSLAAMCVTSAWMPTRNQRSWPDFVFLATVSPRRSRRFRNCSPDFRRLQRTAVNGAPVSTASLRPATYSSLSSPGQLRKRQFTPRISSRR
mmetsp:Transcript_90313/g.292299  ORF Transcript_90313/g.292299 Transcript_90313/m.292299 type:complete len:203 (-) Transcript_90313:595-1203(-)